MKFCIAGTAAFQEITLRNCPKFLLESFYYIQDWQIPLIKNSELFLLDSGAYTFMNNFQGKVNWDEYVKKYGEFINRNNVEYFFELDIDSLVGLKEVERLREKLEKITNKKSIPVWHKSRGLEKYKEICREYNYIAIGGIVAKEIKPSEHKFFLPLLKIAKDYNCKVHGLGFTSTKDLKYYSFYSVDSTSWTSASRFGQISIFDGEKIKNIPRPKNTKIVDYKKALEINLKEWIKFQNYANNYL